MPDSGNVDSKLFTRPRGLETSGSEFQHLLSEIGKAVSPYLDTFPNSTPFLPPVPDSLRSFLLSPPSETSLPLDSLLQQCLPLSQHVTEQNSPYFLAYINSANVVQSAAAQMINMIFNRYVTVGEGYGGAMTLLEQGLIKWMVDTFEMPHTAHGLLTTGGSTAIFTAVVGARERFLANGGDITKARVYISDETHYSLEKSLHFAGISLSTLRRIPYGVRGRGVSEHFAKAIKEDVENGFEPMLLVASSGTTSQGCIEPLSDLADLSKSYGMWYHIDACYGGFFILTPRGKDRMIGINRADTISLDPHKSLYCPNGTGALLIRDAKEMERWLSPVKRGIYMRDLGTSDSIPDYADLGLELSREGRALRIWFPLQYHGVNAYRELLDEKLDLTECAWRRLGEMGMETFEKPDLSVVLARVKGDQEKTDLLLERLHARKKFLFSSTEIDGRAVLRLSLLQWNFRKEHLEVVLEIIKEELARL